jgi:hypothetical protein
MLQKIVFFSLSQLLIFFLIRYFEKVRYTNPILNFEALNITPQTWTFNTDLALAHGVDLQSSQIEMLFDVGHNPLYFSLPQCELLWKISLYSQFMVRNPLAILPTHLSYKVTSHNDRWYVNQFNLYRQLNKVDVNTTGEGRFIDMSTASRPRIMSLASASFIINQFLKVQKTKKNDKSTSKSSSTTSQDEDKDASTGNELGHVEVVVETEDDLQKLSSLPSFGETLTQGESELLLSYLLVPYLRIPLLLRFFSTGGRVKALNNKLLCKVVEAAIFEQGHVVFPMVENIISVENAIELSNSLVPITQLNLDEGKGENSLQEQKNKKWE